MPDTQIPFLLAYVIQGLLVALLLSGPVYLIVVLVRLARRQGDSAAAAQDTVRLQREILATLQQLLAEQRETNRRLDRLSSGDSSR